MPRMKNTARKDGRVKASVYIGLDADGKKSISISMPTITKNLSRRSAR